VFVVDFRAALVFACDVDPQSVFSSPRLLMHNLGLFDSVFAHGMMEMVAGRPTDLADAEVPLRCFAQDSKQESC
jgi:hypothetical protein